jgi:NADH-quinone oxidoreductase subunit D
MGNRKIKDYEKIEGYNIYIEPQFRPLGFPIGLYITLQDDVVINIKPEFGYLKTGVEKLVEGMEIDKVIPFIDRVDSSSAISAELTYCIGLEKIFKIDVPQRAKFIRSILCELSRISSHLLWLTRLANVLGINNALHYCLREREELLNLIELATGSRLTPNFIRVGGVASNLSPRFIEDFKKFLRSFRKKFNMLKAFFLENELVVNRLNNIGVLIEEDAKNLAVTGPNLRALGIKKDVRIDDTYEIYNEISFRIPMGEKGDSLDRCIVRIGEIEQSISIISQAFYKMPEGEIRKYKEDIKHFSGNTCSHIECPHGELGMEISIDEGKITNLRMNNPSYNNLLAFSKAALRENIEDVEVILTSFDVCVCEVDK